MNAHRIRPRRSSTARFDAVRLPGIRMPGIRALGLGLVCAAVFVAGCGLAVDDGPIDVDRPAIGGSEPAVPTPVLATGTGRIFLIAPAAPGVAARLRAVPRDVADAAAVMAAVVAGPSEDEFADEYRSALPSDLVVNGVRLSGSVAAIDIGPQIRDLGGEALVIALAQIVHSIASLDGIDSVRLTVDGAAVTWPDGTGGSSDGPLTVHDFPGLIPSTQPAFPAIPSPTAP